MGTIAKINAGGSDHLIASTAYATSTTGASTAAKTATVQGSQAFTLVDGVTVHVYMTNSNTATSPTLNVNSTGAKPIYRYGTTVPGTTEDTSWRAGSVVSFTYNKTANSSGCWTMNGGYGAEVDTHLVMTPSGDTLTFTYAPVGNANTTSY